MVTKMNEKILEKCRICPRECKINRQKGELGICRAGKEIEIAKASIHYDEEPCISGKNGSGTIFFTHCNLKCVYCQNYKISHEGFGKKISIEHLAEIMLSQQKKGVHNINLVTPTIYIPQIVEAITIAKSKGLIIPIVYNSSGYESVESLKKLEGLIDIYLPDLKYSDAKLANCYSKAKNYFEIAVKAILEMYRQVGDPVFDKQGMMQRGMIIRHMILPNELQNSRDVLSWIKQSLGSTTYISVMAQYFPTYHAKNYKNLSRKITQKELDEMTDYIEFLGFENGYIQELGDHEEEYVPDFDLSE